jgi:hypothetical protein
MAFDLSSVRLHGCRFDPPSDRDFRAVFSDGPVPEQVDLRQFCTPLTTRATCRSHVIARLLGTACLALLAAAALLAPQGCGGAPAPTLPSPVTESCDGVQRSTEPCDGNVYPADPVLPPVPCPSRLEVEQALSEIPVKINADPTAGDLVCRAADGSMDLTVLQFRVYGALLFLRQMKFDAPLPWTSMTVWDWLRTTIPKGIVVDIGDGAFAYLNTKGPIYFNFPAGAWWDHDDHSVKVLPFETVVHEARHAEGYNHTCAWDGTKFRSDKTIAEMGATGIGQYLFQWLALHSRESPDLKRWAQTRADAKRKGSIFCCECGGIPPGSLSVQGAVVR